MNQVAEGVKKVAIIASRLKTFTEPPGISAGEIPHIDSLDEQYRVWIDELSELGTFHSMEQALLSLDGTRMAVFWTEIREYNFVDLNGVVISRQTPSGRELSPSLVPEG